ncbi:MAG: hypothetical protein HYY37_03115 [Candidatus Aenigmarchaeota archaeon]|nr:hypothetical protein [Candidatus Aenigmarchaeota archaeon]
MLSSGNPFAQLGPEFYGFLLPWIFTFAVVYALAGKTPVGEKKEVAAAIALVAAFFVTAVGGPQMAAFFSALFGGSAIFLAGILVVLLFTTLAGVKWEGGTSKMIVLIGLVLLGIFLFIASSGSAVGVLISPDLAALIFWGVIILAVIWMVAYKDAGGAKKE